MRVILFLCATILAATATSSHAINIDEEAWEQMAVNATVEQAGKTTGIYPTGWILVKNIRAIRGDAYPDQGYGLIYIPELWEPVYAKAGYASLTASFPEATDRKYGTTFYPLKQRDVKGTIFSEGKNVTVVQYQQNDIANGNVILTAPADKYNIIPSNTSIAWVSLFL